MKKTMKMQGTYHENIVIFNKHHKKKMTDEVLDYLSLLLAFYLASWGMYRGSSFLLQKDYKVHKDIVIEINSPKYNSFWGINCEALLSEGNLGLLFKLSNRLKDIYVEKRKNIDGRKKQVLR
ncbi:hypothetical protein [Brevibacillus laterosporus]|uniref:hypothetical protein n=1 Tax=Brevibacillus laterosporus TaxID=1465 RepID=UPI0015E23C5C|nr:hypothetical protein [Brevibacillus laterosporus]